MSENRQIESSKAGILLLAVFASDPKKREWIFDHFEIMAGGTVQSRGDLMTANAIFDSAVKYELARLDQYLNSQHAQVVVSKAIIHFSSLDGKKWTLESILVADDATNKISEYRGFKPDPDKGAKTTA